MGKVSKKTSTYLKTVSFSEILLWDVKRYVSSRVESDFPVVSLSNLISNRNQKVRLSGYPDEEFGILGVNNKIGLFDAYTEKGGKINQPYKKVLDGDLAYNPYRVNVGSIGWKTGLQKNDFISPAYVVLSCDKALQPEFLYRIFKTNVFNKIIVNNTTGSVRQILKFELLANIKIPLPSVKEQKQIISNYNKKIMLAERYEKQAKQIQQEIENYILKMLGVNKLVIKGRSKGLQIAAFKDIGRWSVDYISKQATISLSLDGKYKNSKLEEFMLSCQYGLSLKSHKEPIGVPMLRMSNIFDSEVALDDVKYINIAEDIRQKYLLAKGDLLFNRTNSKELVGKTAVFEEDGEYTFASYIIRVKLDSSKVNANYINYLFNSSVLKSQKDTISRQTLGQANINSKELQSFLFPLPPLKIQNQIAEKINQMKMELHYCPVV